MNLLKNIYKANQCTDENDCLIAIKEIKNLIHLREKCNKPVIKAWQRLISLEKKLSHFKK